MRAKLYIEFLKLVHKPRTYIGPAAMAVLVALMLVAVKFGHASDMDGGGLSRDFVMTGSFVNAAFLTRFMLFELIIFVFLPLFSCMIFGDLIASESADGTLRTMLCRPVTRLGVAMAKYLAGIVYVFALTFGTGLLAYIAGTLFLGHGSLLTMSDGIWILPEHTAILRLLAAYTLVSVGMVAVGSIAFAISTVLNNANGAIAGAMGVVIFSSIIGPIQYFASMRPYLLTTYLRVSDFFTGKFDIQLFSKSLGVMLIYAIVALGIGLVIFVRRDVLS